MGKKNRSGPVPESLLLLPFRASPTTIVDTHTHLLSTFALYRSKYPAGKYETIYDFVKGLYADRHVHAIVDVWCEAPVQKTMWKEIADSAIDEADRRVKWGGLEYWFVMGVHPHEAKHYNDEVENDIISAMAHPRCVGWGEMGLDFHYDNSPRDVQRAVFRRQLTQAVRLNKPLTIHTREADADTEAILKELVPKDHKIHIHCFTDSPAFAKRLLDHFPNLYIGITGVITYSSNVDTSNAIREMMASPGDGSADAQTTTASPLRIVLETDAPYMVPANLYSSLSVNPSNTSSTTPNASTEPPPPPSTSTTASNTKSAPKSAKGGAKKNTAPSNNSNIGKLPISHSAMIPWTAEFVANVVNSGREAAEAVDVWDAERVLSVARENARACYGV